MEKLVGRARFTNGRVRRTGDSKEEEFQAELHGTSDETHEEWEKREAEERGRNGGDKPGCDCAEGMTPIQQFKAASDKRWGIGRDRRGADAAPALPASTTPMQRFIAASNARHGIRR